jgi:hypothetical protein
MLPSRKLETRAIKGNVQYSDCNGNSGDMAKTMIRTTLKMCEIQQTDRRLMKRQP